VTSINDSTLLVISSKSIVQWVHIRLIRCEAENSIYGHGPLVYGSCDLESELDIYVQDLFFHYMFLIARIDSTLQD
jgi:hypothetical protein